MAITKNALILVLSIVALSMGYYYYQSRQNVVEIQLPNISIEKR